MALEKEPYYIVMNGPSAGRVEAKPSNGSTLANGQWLRKDKNLTVYMNLGRYLEPDKVIKQKLTLVNKLNNWLFKHTGHPLFLKFWKSPQIQNPEYSDLSFRLPDYKHTDMLTVILKQSTKMLANHPVNQ